MNGRTRVCHVQKAPIIIIIMMRTKMACYIVGAKILVDDMWEWMMMMGPSLLEKGVGMYFEYTYSIYSALSNRVE